MKALGKGKTRDVEVYKKYTIIIVEFCSLALVLVAIGRLSERGWFMYVCIKKIYTACNCI